MKELSIEIKIYLDEIAERLWSNHASVMVGAGFSKNALENGPNCKPFLSWNELANIFYKKLHNREPSSSEHYLNPLKLADELQAAFGRSTLEKIILTELPDLAYNPSDLHKDLLELPWNDVFTTNYDTLLERTQVAQRYDVVVNKNDLVFSQRPRIIKLHGSFPSERPFIITEDDYRKYPREYSLFVNTVQQALIENTLCLIGFSGDDPNFLNWIGWIRDNLGVANSPKIYLVGSFGLSSSQIKLLEQRNIVVVNFASHFESDPERHKKALDIFVSYLKSKKNEENRLDWPRGETPVSPGAHLQTPADLTKEIEDVVAKWKNSREEYPGWIICPEDRRSVLWFFTQHWTFGVKMPSDVPNFLDLDFYYELSWRLEKCLQSTDDRLVENIEKTLRKH